MPSIFYERESRFSGFIKFDTPFQFAEESTSADDEAETDGAGADGAADETFPKLSYLRVECERVRPGMGDFIVRVSSPKYASLKSNTILSFRGDRRYAKFDEIRKFAKLVAAEMERRGDKTFVWPNLDVEHLANMVVGPLKYFATSLHLKTLAFSTEALA